MGDANQGGDVGLRRKFLFKLHQQKGDIEQTQMTPDFIKNMERYDDYKLAIDRLIDKLQACVQMNPEFLQRKDGAAARQTNSSRQLFSSRQKKKKQKVASKETAPSSPDPPAEAPPNKEPAQDKDQKPRGQKEASVPEVPSAAPAPPQQREKDKSNERIVKKEEKEEERKTGGSSLKTPKADASVPRKRRNRSVKRKSSEGVRQHSARKTSSKEGEKSNEEGSSSFLSPHYRRKNAKSAECIGSREPVNSKERLEPPSREPLSREPLSREPLSKEPLSREPLSREPLYRERGSKESTDPFPRICSPMKPSREQTSPERVSAPAHLNSSRSVSLKTAPAAVLTNPTQTSNVDGVHVSTSDLNGNSGHKRLGAGADPKPDIEDVKEPKSKDAPRASQIEVLNQGKDVAKPSLRLAVRVNSKESGAGGGSCIKSVQTGPPKSQRRATSPDLPRKVTNSPDTSRTTKKMRGGSQESRRGNVYGKVKRNKSKEDVFGSRRDNVVAEPKNNWGRQNGAIECPSTKCPYENLSVKIESYLHYIPHDKRGSLKKISANYAIAANKERSHQIKLKECIDKFKHFGLTDFATMELERDKLDRVRNNMDLAKHEVKACQKVDQIERKAVVYQQCVEEFDVQCNKVIKLGNDIPLIKEKHEAYMTEFFALFKAQNLSMMSAYKKE